MYTFNIYNFLDFSLSLSLSLKNQYNQFNKYLTNIQIFDRIYS